MQPIVGGLEQKYGDKVAFIRVNVTEEDGAQAFKESRLAGHPSYLILTSEGTELWRAVGLQSEDTLSAALDSSLAQFQPVTP